MEKRLITGCGFHYILGSIAMGVLIFLLTPALVFTQEAEPGEISQEEIISPIEEANAGEAIPEQIRRPSRGEDPRYPRDAVIGELGRGQASDEAYAFARELFSALLWQNLDSAVLSDMSTQLRDEIIASQEAINAQKFRIGGGREEDDGSTSFLFRFIGREQGAAGELYLRRKEETWQVDDVLIEEPRDILNKGNVYAYDFTPYERFF
jgi:hypothetical protein